MPDPISRTTPPACDPSVASCEDAPPSPAAVPASVTIEAVVITGDAGTQELLRRYESAALCSNEKQAALMLSCPAIGLGALNSIEGGPWVGVASAGLASIGCGKDLRALYDCHEHADILAEGARAIIDDCHERGGIAKLGSSLNEILCEVTP
jgi:hypothetical protein